MSRVEATTYKANPSPYDAIETNCGWSVHGDFGCDPAFAATCPSMEGFAAAPAATSGAAIKRALTSVAPAPTSAPPTQELVAPLPQEHQPAHLFYDPYASEPAWIPYEQSINCSTIGKQFP